ncbi:hypothetical protein CUMW_140170 [Citrus unshiu]|nr:hypothetical protein CUMW_140170 [Citrus unshiu]
MQPFLSPLRLQCFRFLTPLPSLNHSLLFSLPMAQKMLMRLDLGSRCGAIRALGILCLVLLMQKSEAREFLIGGKGNWGTPTDNTTLNYNQWAEKNRFQIGDSIVFNYASGQDSVLQVNKDAYTNCSTEYPVARYTDGHTVFTFKQSGPYYFISGNKDNCVNNEKLAVIVLADRSNHLSNTTTGMTPSSPPSPSTDVVPAPAPAGEYSPPEGTVEVNPTPAPEPNKKPNAASSTFVNVASTIGAFAASSLLLAF